MKEKHNMEREELEALIRSTIQANFTQTRDALREEISGEHADRFETLTTEVRGLRNQLTQMGTSGEVDALDEPAQDLERRLSEAEEQLRLVQTARPLPSAAGPMEEGFFGGQLIANLQALRQRLIETRTIDTSLLATAGKLNPDQSNQFLDFVVAEQATLGRVTDRRMVGPSGYTDRLSISNRILRKATEGTAPTVADSISTGRRTLTAVEMILAEDLSLSFLEDNIERAGAEGHIARMLGTQTGNDLNDLFWNGDEDATDSSGPEPFLSINNGIIKLMKADAAVNDCSGASLTTAVSLFQKAVKTMPSRYLTLPGQTFFVPVSVALNYANEVMARTGAVADETLFNGLPVNRFFGYPIVPESALQADEAYFGPASNLYLALQRLVTAESDWNQRKRLVEYTITVRGDFEYAFGGVAVLIDAIDSGLL